MGVGEVPMAARLKLKARQETRHPVEASLWAEVSAAFARLEAENTRLRAQRDAVAAVLMGVWTGGVREHDPYGAANVRRQLARVDPAEAARLGAMVFGEGEGD